MTIDETWNILETEDSGSVPSGYLTRRIFLEGQQDLRLAIEKPSGTRLLMMRIHRHSLATGMTFPDSNGFEVKRAVLPGDGEKYLTLQLILTNHRFQDIFTALVEDISANIASIPVESDAVQFMNSRLRRWQLFLERNGPDGLGEESQHGLYGELWVLRQHVLPQLGALGVEYWTGPTGAVQDFQFPGYAIEVKTTVTKQPQKISISNEHQLDESASGELTLFHLSVQVQSGVGETLADIIFSLRSLLGKNSSFHKRLFEAGYLDMHAQKYTNLGYTGHISTCYRVEQGFPRIVPAALPTGVENVRYRIQIPECRPFRIEESEVLSRIRTQFLS